MEKQNWFSSKWALLGEFQITYLQLPQSMYVWPCPTNTRTIQVNSMKAPQIPTSLVEKQPRKEVPSPQSSQWSLTSSYILLENWAIWNIEFWAISEWNQLHNIWLSDDHFSVWIQFISRALSFSWLFPYTLFIPFKLRNIPQLVNLSTPFVSCLDRDW